MSGFKVDSQGYYIESAQGDTRDYGIKYGKFLQVGETVVSSTWSIPAGVTSVTASISGDVALNRIHTTSAGTFVVTNTMTSSSGQVLNRSFRILVKPKL